MIFRSSVPDNVTNMRVFDDDEKIISFLTNEESFKESIIDEEEHLSSLQNEDADKGNFTPKAVRPPEAGMILRNHTYLKVYKCW